MKKFVFLTLLSLLANLAYADEKIEIVPVGPAATANTSEIEYQTLKNETRINQLQDEIEELKQQIEKLDLVQRQILSKLNSLLPQEKQFVNSHVAQNNTEFQYGYDMLVKGESELAKRSFKLFVDKYPEDEKVGEAYFWLGELFYNEKNYTEASKYYLVSYRDHPTAPKRNESLFKLSMVLNFLGKADEACAGFDLLQNDNTVTPALKEKAISEAVIAGCSN